MRLKCPLRLFYMCHNLFMIPNNPPLLEGHYEQHAFENHTEAKRRINAIESTNDGLVLLKNIIPAH